VLYYPERHESLSRTAWDERRRSATLSPRSPLMLMTVTIPSNFWPPLIRAKMQREVLKGLWFGGPLARFGALALPRWSAEQSPHDSIAPTPIARVHSKFLAEDPPGYSGFAADGRNRHPPRPLAMYASSRRLRSPVPTDRKQRRASDRRN